MEDRRFTWTITVEDSAGELHDRAGVSGTLHTLTSDVAQAVADIVEDAATDIDDDTV
jgi:hypothetical protein